MSKRIALIALNIAIVLVVIGGTVAFATFSKSITLRVDGKASQVRTFAGSVSGVLDARDVKVGSRDKVSDGLGASVSDDDTIVVKHARPLTLTLDGVTTTEWAYETSVGQVLQRVGVFGTPGLYVSAAASDPIPRDGLTLVVSTPKTISVKADGRTSTLTTPAATVADVLAEAGITVDADDETSPTMDTPLTQDQGIKVVRIVTATKSETVPVAFKTLVKDDDSLYKGDVEVTTTGKKGKNREKVVLTTADGKVRDRKVLDSVVLTQPVTQVERHGTKPLPSVWDRLAQCESGGNWKTNTGNGFYGGLQFSASTWRAVGGSGLPHQNSREEQIKRGIILQERAGWGQWPGCSRKLGLR
ncbi:resuscitation-promoting factor [soil metagenome]